MKPISYANYKAIRKMTLNELNRWAGVVWKSGFEDGLDAAYEDVIVEIGTEDLLLAIMSVKGIGEKRARQVMDAILSKAGGDKNDLP